MRWLAVLLACAAVACARGAKLPPPDAGSGGPAGSGNGGDSSVAGTGGNGGNAGAAGVPGPAGNGGTGGGPDLPALSADALLEASCFRYVDTAQLLPANILFVLDRSGSMACNPPPITDSATCERDGKRATADPSKWEITQSAIVETLNILPEDSWVGLSYFSNDDACGVQSSPTVLMRKNSALQKDVIRTSLARSKPGGATPLVGATILAYQYVYELVRDSLIRGNNFVVLLADGKQSEMCGDPGRCTTAEECTNYLIDKEVPKASGPGVWIRTFVIGVPGSELDSRTLSRIAVAGGTARPNCDPDRDCHFDVSRGGDFSADLRQALTNIVGQTRSCDLPAPREPENRQRVNLIYTPPNRPRELIHQDTKPCDAGANGWQFAEGDDTRIRLCGDVCTRLRDDPEGQLQVVIGCPIQGPQ